MWMQEQMQLQDQGLSFIDYTVSSDLNHNESWKTQEALIEAEKQTKKQTGSLWEPKFKNNISEIDAVKSLVCDFFLYYFRWTYWFILHLKHM